MIKTVRSPTTTTIPAAGDMHKTGRRCAGLGSAVWLLAVTALCLSPGPDEMRWAAGLFLLAPLVLLPLALPLTIGPIPSRGTSRLWAILWRGQFPAATLAAIAFVLPAGAWAGVLAIPWLLTTGLIALIGLLDFLAGKVRSVERLCYDAAMIYLTVGGVAAVMSRLELTVFGFSDIIILATAVHFHYAGCVLLILAGKIAQHQPGAFIRVAAVCALAGMPTLAAGITLSRFDFRYPEWLAAIGMSVAATAIALLQCRLAVQHVSGNGRSLLLISGLSLIAAMSMAILFAAGVFRGIFVLGIDIPWMLHYHAVVNALGFALCGLCAWHAIPRRRNSDRGSN